MTPYSNCLHICSVFRVSPVTSFESHARPRVREVRDVTHLCQMRNGKLLPPNLGPSLLSCSPAFFSDPRRGLGSLQGRGDSPLGSVPTFLRNQVEPKLLSALVCPPVLRAKLRLGPREHRQVRQPGRPRSRTGPAGPGESRCTCTLENRPKQPMQLMMQYTLGRRGPRPVGWGGTERLPQGHRLPQGFSLLGLMGRKPRGGGWGTQRGKWGQREKDVAGQRFCTRRGQQEGQSSPQSQKLMAWKEPNTAAISASTIWGLQREGASMLWR